MRPEGLRFFGAILLTVSLLIAWSALYYSINFFILLEEQADRLLRLESQASNAQLAMLRYQLNPHFLFNTLNSISTLVLLKQTDRANAMLSRLSSFLRYTLVNESIGMVTLAQEIETLKLYLEIEKMRFEERLRPHFHIDPAATRAHLPSLLLQPLIENAIKYAVTPQEEGADISIEARRQAERVVINVSDTGPGASTTSRSFVHRRRSGEHSGPSGAGLWRQSPLRDTIGHHRGLPRFHRYSLSNRNRGAEMTIRTILVDDEPLAIQGLQLRLEPHDDVEIIDTCSNGREAIRSIKTHKPDLVFLDIQMPGFDGFSVIQGLMEVEPPLFVFVTAYSDHAIRAFEAQAVDYLMKPVDEARLADTLDRVRQRLAEKRGVEEVGPAEGGARRGRAGSDGERRGRRLRRRPCRQPLREIDQHQGPRPDFPRRRRFDREDRRRRRLYVHLYRRQHAYPARDDEGPGKAPRSAPLPARPPLDDRQSRPGPSSEAAHQRRMLPGARFAARR